MLVEKISFTPECAYQWNKQASNEPLKTQKSLKELSKYAYKDYNISFGERLFRTPENFYEQSFNQKNMPDSMKTYLYEDYEDRKHIPPAQMMKIVFDDLNDINSLDMVARVFSSDEPLFSNLSDKPKRNARKGIVSEVEAMRSEFDEMPLFKDGTSNFGMYLLRKIYLEGKMLKEINEDFKKDLSPVYEGLISSPIDYDTFSAYGIKFPKYPFWKSFTATREDFPYVYRPRKIGESRLNNPRERSFADIIDRLNSKDTRPPKFRVDKDFDKKGKNIGDALILGHGNRKLTEKALRHKGLADDEELSFVSKYMSQIMSVALEKTHASEEMRSFFEAYDSLGKKQREKMEAYWRNNTLMREFQSLAISDTIKLFYEAYGADGNNEEFHNLLAYADNIKPNRVALKAAHDERQVYYDELFEELDLANKEFEEDSDIIQSSTKRVELSQEQIDKKLEEEAIKNGAEVFSFISTTGEQYRFVGNIDEMFANEMKLEYNLMPASFVKKFTNFALKSPYATYDYKKTAGLVSLVPEFVIPQLMPLDECRSISWNINKAFDTKYKQAMRAAEQAMSERVAVRLSGENIDYHALLTSTAMSLQKMCNLNFKITSWTDEEKDLLEKSYLDYALPLTDKREISKINDKMVELITQLNSYARDNGDKISDVDLLLSKVLEKYPKARIAFSKAIRKSNFVEKYGGTAKLLINDNVPVGLKFAKSRLMLDELISIAPDVVIDLLAMDGDYIIKYVNDEKLRSTLLVRHIFLAKHGIITN